MTASDAPAAAVPPGQAPESQPLRSVCVYCGASNRVSDDWKDLAHAVGALLGSSGIRLVYGGGAHGLMGRVAEGARQAGGDVLGVVPTFLKDRESISSHLTQSIETNSMHERKQQMVNHADGFLVLPGGFGSLDELFEVLTWKQLGLITQPVVLFNHQGYWNSLLTLISNMIREGFCSADDRENLLVCDQLDAVLGAMASYKREAMDASWKFI